MLRALIVDRDAMTSHLLADALVRNRKCDTAAIPSSDLLRTLATREIDLVVIGADVNSGPGTGFDLADAVCRAHPEVIIVLLLNQTDHESVINAFRSGARGVFSRQRPMTEFLDCIDHVKKGYIWAGKEETNSLLQTFKNIPAPGGLTASTSPPLTKREFEVVQCAAKGKTNRAIANELGLSEHTVKNYLFRAFDKLGISNRVELLFYLTVRGHTFGAKQKPDEPYASSPPALSRSSLQDQRDPGQELRPASEPIRALAGNDYAGSA
ncbi:MAG TPA: response regulator transcription factor [Silvibacterium sp.]|nr:response regulator transcription factor [Silvibacterium sp.]